ncbi:MAG: cystathionine beta-lyase [Candidatus Puniceispirillales bacterium]
MKKGFKSFKIETLTSHSGKNPDENFGIPAPPLYRTSTILSSNMNAYRNKTGKYTYGRNGTPTTESLSLSIAKLYNADGCVLAPSGMSAITTGLMSTIKTNEHILVPDSVYGSTRRFVKEEFPRLNIDYQFYNSRDIDSLETLIRENTSAIYIETPGTYTFEIIDIEEVIRVCKKYKLKSIIDNTWATALYFNPLEFGVDIVIEAVTKYISGHSDIMMGAVVANDENLINLQRWTRNSGTYVSPDDVYLSLRGLRTLPLRLKQSSENSFALAKYLETKKEVKKVIHPALTQHPEHEKWKKYFNGSSGLFAIEFQDYITQTDVDRLADACKIFGIGASWGGYSSLLSTMNISENRHLKSSYVPKGEYLRVYAGSENIDDLINDLEKGFTELNLK